MKESRSYQTLCKESSSVLNSPNCSINLFSISWLHIIRDHPIYTKSYSDYFENNNLLFLTLKSILRFFQNLAISLVQFIKKILALKKFSRVIDQRPADVIFLSHLVDSKNFYDSKDFYFGNVPMEISNDLKVEIVYFNWTNDEHFFTDDQIQRTILDQKYNFFQEIKILSMASYSVIDLLYILFNREITLRFFMHILPHVFSIQTINNYRRYLQFLEIFKNKKPSKVICTFEGHAHEKIFFIAAKKINQKISTFAYQHSAIFKNQFSVLNHYLPECIPDYILASGNFPAKILNRAYPDSEIKVVGSHKCGEDTSLKKNFDVPNFLFVPEGFESETMNMLSFAAKCATVYKNINIIFRLHPLVAENSIIKKQLKLLSLENFTFSNNSMDDDLDYCHFVIYRGSTAVIDAVMAKLIPIYFDDPNDLCELDALYMHKKKVVIHPEDLKEFASLNKHDYSLLLSKHQNLFNFIESLREKITFQDFGIKSE